MSIPPDVQARIDELTEHFNARFAAIVAQIETLNTVYGRKIQLLSITEGDEPEAVPGCPTWTQSGLMMFFPEDWSDLEIRLDEYFDPLGLGQVMGFKLTMNGADYLREINYGSADWSEAWRAAQ